MQPLSDLGLADGPSFQRVYLGQLGGLKAVCERLPDVPAVYAFVRNIPLPPAHNVEQFLTTIQSAIEMKAAPDHTAGLGPLHRVTMESVSRLSDRKVDDLAAYAQNPEFRKIVRSVFAHAAALQAPLYVGKAISLQNRFAQHMKPMSDLSCRLREVGISFEQCILLYTELDSLPSELDRDALNLIEEILSRLLRPGFVKRIG